MTETRDPLSRAETGDLGRFSKLEASLVQTEVEQRPNSRAQNDIDRHAEATDLNVNELDFNFNLGAQDYPLDDLRSLQQVFDAVQFHQHLDNSSNFSLGTNVECLNVDSRGAEWHALTEHGMDVFLKHMASKHSPPSPGKSAPGRRLLAFFVPLVPIDGTSFGARAMMTQGNALQLMKTLQVNPLFLLNLIGRPDYWAPKSHWESDSDGKLTACDLFCQHPRWNLHVQGSPLSVYVRHDIIRNLTTYVISHKEGDTSINTLKSLLNIAMNTANVSNKPAVLMDDPFDIHVILSTLSLEASKHHVKRFQRFMWVQINKVNDHLAGLEASDRSRLGDLTKQLQIVSQNADSHIANADVAIFTATAIRNAHFRLISALPESSPYIHQRVEDSIAYVISSMEKQKTWFLNYKQRKDSTMSLVYNLVTQQDAANNIQIARSMKADSTSMTAIAVLTMAFLPGTFTATVVDAGILGNAVRERSWFIWLVVTLPLTLAVMFCWWVYQKAKEPKMKRMPEKSTSEEVEAVAEAKVMSSLRRRSAFSSFSFRGGIGRG
ncbi:hypothetical protein N7532_005088 [Penicillium argentinense]|uniref:Uncharacterized protein n=1 Tax=Penicillium argentinense TaxID=1131581 RepID=A0A9W9KAL5_9EURO|nr:uncharacterized protein N7532_005088 [Penicillium argentinense]KAJ5098087.1 hypothetical protein N7532_005088 [Penicillium argentinense]